MKLLCVTILLMSSAFAQPSPQNWNWPDCGKGGAESFALGNIRPSDNAVIDEHDDMLEMAQPVCPALTVVTTTYVTTFPHHVQGVSMQMGSGLDAIMEWAMWLDIYLPDGRQFRLRQQYDKHTDTTGNKVTYIPVDWSLPIGTMVVIRRPAVNCVGTPKHGIYNPYTPSDFFPYDPNICITGQSITLVGKTNP